MARVRKSDFAFDAISLEGSLISPAKLAAVAERKATDQTDAGYHIPKGLTLRDETARYFRIGQAPIPPNRPPSALPRNSCVTSSASRTSSRSQRSESTANAPTSSHLKLSKAAFPSSLFRLPMI